MSGDRSSGFYRQQHRFFVFCVAPSLAVLALITLLPSLYLLATSFTPLNLTRPETQWDFSEPFESYRQLWTDSRLHNSIWVQIKLSFWTVTLQLLIGLGLALLADRNPFARLSSVRVPFVANPFGRAYLYGLLLGPLALPCAGAFALALIAYSVGLTEAVEKILVYLAYGLGFGLPLVVLSLLAGARQQQIVRYVTRHHRAIDVVAGVLLIAVGIGDLILNWDNLRRTFGL